MAVSVGHKDYNLRLSKDLADRYERAAEAMGMTYTSDAMKHALHEWIEDWEARQALKAFARDRRLLEDLPDRVREALLDELE